MLPKPIKTGSASHRSATKVFSGASYVLGFPEALVKWKHDRFLSPPVPKVLSPGSNPSHLCMSRETRALAYHATPTTPQTNYLVGIVQRSRVSLACVADSRPVWDAQDPAHQPLFIPNVQSVKIKTSTLSFQENTGLGMVGM